MSEKIKLVVAYYQSLMCPTIITGHTSNNWTVYARYRFGHLSVRLDIRNPAPFEGASGVWIMAKQLDPNGMGGSIDYEELKALTSELIDWPDNLSARRTSEVTDTWLEL